MLTYSIVDVADLRLNTKLVSDIAARAITRNLIVLFRIIQSCNVPEDNLNRSDADKFSQLILVDTPETLRSTALYFHYNHPQIVTIKTVATNLTHLQIVFYGTLNDVSIYSLIPLLRIHSALRSLCVTIKSTEQPMSISINVPSLPSINEDDLPKSLLLKKFDLQIVMIRCDIQLIGLILRCMPNLHRFVFTIIVDKNISPFMMDLINGQNWREMLTCHVPYLNKFDFHMSLLTNGQPIDLDNILNSFRSFINLYEKWDMCISRWKFMPYIPYLPLFPFEHIHLWTLNYNHVITRREYDMPTIIISDTFDIRSTNRFNLNKYHHHFPGKKMHFFMTKKTITTTTAPQLATTVTCENINYIICHLAYPYPAIISYLENSMIRLNRRHVQMSQNLL
ncbi:unnamed protein product [Rotaria sp. Silwood2]|nr:unnamed protein product [Rotaria sp. Silwood2]